VRSGVSARRRRWARGQLRSPMVKALTCVCIWAPLVTFSACDRVAPERGYSRDFEREVDDVNERNRAVHERSQELDQRLTELSHRVEALRAELAPLSVQWAYDASRELEAGLAQARERLATLRAGTGFDWEAMALAADEAIDELEASYERVRDDLTQGAE